MRTMQQISKQDLEKLSHNKQILFACFCAKQVFHLAEEEHKEACLKAIKTAYLFLEGKASKEECYAVANAAYTAYAANAAAYATYAASAAAYAAASAAAAAYYATTAAYYAAHAASYAASAADKPLIIEAQWAFYDQLLNGDKYFEQIVLEKA